MSDPVSVYPPTSEWERPTEVWVIQPPRVRLWLHIVLLLLTFLSTLVVGAHMQFNFVHHQPVFSLDDDLFSGFVSWIAHPSRLLAGIPFSLTLMLILLSHEMGHYLCARHYRVYATLPYFIPFPSLIGTLGAFIRIKSPIPSSAALFDIGIAGPIAGFIPACVALLVGLSLSHPTPVPNVPYIELGFPLIFRIAARLFHFSDLASVSLHPVAVAAWVGIFATSLNLLPGGQLDGGHIVFSIFPRLHRWITLVIVVVLITAVGHSWKGWYLWGALLALTARHPSVPSRPSVAGRRRWLAIFALAMLILTFTRVPLTQHPDQDVWPDLRDGARNAIHWLKDSARHALHRRQ